MLTTILEILGIVSFAISGADKGMRKKLDLFGAYILALATCFGGGLLRDVILGITPPLSFRSPRNLLIATAATVIFLIRPLRKALRRNERLYELLLFLFDSLGLGVFTVMGVDVALTNAPWYGPVLPLFVGVITGVGGGVLRDTMAGDIPQIFVKHIYALASLAGAVVCLVIWKLLGREAAMVAGTSVTFLIRCFSAHFRWNLPSADEE